MTGSADAAPSFNCATARIDREKAICHDRRLAGLDQEIADAYARALSRFDSAAAAKLRQDQRGFISNLDDALERHSHPEDDTPAYRAYHMSLIIEALEDVLSKRLRFLKSLEPGRRTLAGKWQNAWADLSVTPAKTSFTVTFSYMVYGFPRYSCDFEAQFETDGGGLRGTITRRVVEALGDEVEFRSEATLQRRGATLELDNTGEVCSHDPDHDVLFPVE